MKEFEELEGLSDQHIDEDLSAANIDEPDEDESFRPTIAANLNNADVYDEVQCLFSASSLFSCLLSFSLSLPYCPFLFLLQDGKTWS